MLLFHADIAVAAMLTTLMHAGVTMRAMLRATPPPDIFTLLLRR